MDFLLNISSLFDIISPGFSLYVDKAEDNEFLILITEFSGSGGYDPTTRIYRSLNEALKASSINGGEDGESIKVSIKRVPDQPAISQEAWSIGERYGAAIVIWGSYDNAAIEPSIEVLRDWS